MKPPSHCRAGVLISLSILVGGPVFGPTAWAAAVLNVLNSGLWSDVSVWSSGSQPTAADTVTLRDAGIGGGLPVSLTLGDTGHTVDALTVNAASRLMKPGGFALLDLSGLSASGSINAPLTLDAVGLRWFNQGMANSLTVSSDVILDNQGFLSGGGGPGSGGLRFSGTTTINSSTANGQVWIGPGEKIGGGTTTFADSVRVSLSGNFKLKDGTLELNGTGANATALPSGLVFAATSFNPVALVNKGTITAGEFSNQNIRNEAAFGPPAELKNQGLFEKTGTGPLYFNQGGASPLSFRNTGTLRISSGWVEFFSSSGYVQEGAGSLLDLAGGDVTFRSIAGIAAGALAVTGQRTITATPGFLLRAELRIDIAGAGEGQADRLNFVGPLTLDPVNDPGATLVVNNTGGSYPGGTAFTILSASSLSGTFRGLPDGTEQDWGDGQLFRINYSATDVTLTAVPEPELGAVLTALGVAGFALWRRHHWNV